MDEGGLLALCRALVERARAAGADEAEAVASWHHARETRLENGEIHSVESTDETTFGLRVFVGGALGFVTANQTDSVSLDECAAEAVTHARATPSDPFNDLPEPEPLTPVPGLYDERLVEMSVEDTTRLAAMMVDRVRTHDARVRIDSGSVGTSFATAAIASSAGVEATERSTSAEGYLFGMAVDGDDIASFDYDGDGTRNADELERVLEATTDRFVDKCVAGLRTQRGRSFKGSIVLSPDAVAELLLPGLVGAISADAVRKGRSALAGKLGHSIAATSLTLMDDGTLAGGLASSAFDREGIPLRRQALIQDGTLATYLYNHYEAVAAGDGHRSTGHATGSASSLPGIGTSALEIVAGDVAAADLLAGDGPALYVGRFSGSSNGVTGDFSGVVKNGFLAEGGSRRHVRETLIAGNLFEMLERISAISAERRSINGSALLPSIRVDGISVTAG